MSKEQPVCFLTKPQQKAVIPFYSLLYNNIGSDMSWFRQPEFEKYFGFEDSDLLGCYWKIVTVVTTDSRVIFKVSQSKKSAGFKFILIWIGKNAKNPWTKGTIIFQNNRIGKWSDKYLFHVNAYLILGGSVDIQNSERSLQYLFSNWITVLLDVHE